MAKRTPRRSYDMQFHGTAEYRGGNCPSSVYYNHGRFGRLFPALPPLRVEKSELMKLGAPGGLMDGKDAEGTNPDHPGALPAGFTFLGQFIDHDVTFDPTSSLERQVDPEAVENFRTPVLELDNVYGSGPGASPHLYRRSDRALMLVGQAGDGDGPDLPRNQEFTALVGDPRNDENLIVSQLHAAFLRFHNAVAEDLRPHLGPGETLFELAQRMVRWHYQWIVVNEYLPLIVGEPMVRAVRGNRRFYKWRNLPFIPVEFAVAAFRFGHTQVRPGYQISGQFARPIFAKGAADPGDGLPPDLTGGRRIKQAQVVDWRRLFEVAGDKPQVSKRFDPKVSSPLHRLPFAQGTPDDPESLAQRNLLRGLAFGLPSGQAVAQAMRAEHQKDVEAIGKELAPIEILTEDDLTELKPFKMHRETPLWYYILKEADLQGGGRTLGSVGGRIVAEVFLGLLEGDRLSFLRAHPGWRPRYGKGETFGIADLLDFAGVVSAEAVSGPPTNSTWSA